jgi:hypothetical protein
VKVIILCEECRFSRFFFARNAGTENELLEVKEMSENKTGHCDIRNVVRRPNRILSSVNLVITGRTSGTQRVTMGSIILWDVKGSAWYLLLASYLLGLLFDPEGGSSTLLRNGGKLLPDCAASQPRQYCLAYDFDIYVFHFMNGDFLSDHVTFLLACL